MSLRLRFSGAADLVDTVRRSGTTHWLSPDTMRFFRTRVHETLYGDGGRVFVTGETSPSGDRRYTVRVLCVDSDAYSVQTIGAFGAYTSRNGAHDGARRVGAQLTADDTYVDSARADVIATMAGIPFTGGY